MEGASNEANVVQHLPSGRAAVSTSSVHTAALAGGTTQPSAPTTRSIDRPRFTPVTSPTPSNASASSVPISAASAPDLPLTTSPTITPTPTIVTARSLSSTSISVVSQASTSGNVSSVFQPHTSGGSPTATLQSSVSGPATPSPSLPPPSQSGRSSPTSTSWRSASLRRPYLSFLILLSLLLLGSIETLRQISNRRNGLFYLNESNSAKLPVGVTILYNYLPTLLGVVYSVLWSYIDLDTKRLEPYFQMKTDRSSSHHLFLDYVFESAFATPYRALRRRHWFVAAVSFTYLCISLILPASQGALLNIESISFSTSQEDFWLGQPGQGLGSIPNGEFIDQAMAIGMSDGARIPPWMTANHSVTPFWPVAQTVADNRTWTARSTLYGAQPSCRKFNIENAMLLNGRTEKVQGFTSRGLSTLEAMVLTNISIMETPSCYLTLRIHIVMFPPLASQTYIFPVFTYGFSAPLRGASSRVTDVSVHEPPAGERDDIVIKSNSSLSQSISWRDSAQLCPARRRIAGFVGLDFGEAQFTDQNWNVSTIGTKLALYDCRSDYQRVQGEVTVKAGDRTVTKIEPFDFLAPLSENEFNGTAWEDYLETGPQMFENASAVNNRLPGRNLIDHQYNIGDVALSNAVSKSNTSGLYNSLLDDNRVGDAFESAYKLTFALACQTVLQSPGPMSTTEGVTDIDTFAVVIVAEFAILSEILLAVAIVVLLLLTFCYNKRSNILCSDPDSVSTQCSIIADVFDNFGIMDGPSQNFDLLSTKELQAALVSSHLEIRQETQTLQVVTPGHTIAPTVGNTNSMVVQRTMNVDLLPFFLSKRGVITAVTVSSSVVVTLVVLAVWADRRHGFSFLADSGSFRSQLFWSFMPTLIATCVETAWTSMHRDLCVLEPWVAIRKGHTRVRDSLSLRYSSRPPSLVLYQSLKRRHFVLSLVSFSCVMASVLNISMAGLFLGTFNDIARETSTVSYYTPTASLGNYSVDYKIDQAFSVLRNQLSDNGSLPSWTTQNYSLIPLKLKTSDPDIFVPSQQILTAFTIAIGSSLDCIELDDISTRNASGPGVVTDGANVKTVRYTPSPSMSITNTTCITNYPSDSALQSIYIRPFSLLHIPNGTVVKDFTGDCSKLLFVITHDIASQLSSYHVCTPKISVSRVAFQYKQDVETFLSRTVNVSDSDSTSSMFSNRDALLASYRDSFNLELNISRAQTATTDYDWAGLLMTRVRKNDGIESIPELADRVWSSTFAIWFSIYRDRLLTRRRGDDPDLSSTTAGTLTRREARIVPAIPAFIVSIALFVLYLGVYIFVVIRRRHRYMGPRMPKTIGSIVPWAVHSRMLDDFRGTHRLKSRDRDAVLGRLDRRYGFGRFRGRHGKVVLGLEHEELLIARGAFGDF